MNGPAYETVSGLGSGWLPTALAISFSDPIEFGFGGSGETIALLTAALPTQSDINAYDQGAGLPVAPTIKSYTFDSGDSNPTSDDTTEATLDVETVAGLAPYATIDVVELPDLSSENELSGLSSAIQQLQPNVISISFESCESTDDSFDESLDQVTQEAAAIGETIVASAGDQGPTCYEDGEQSPGVGQPASDPFVVGAGANEDLIQPPYSTYAQVARALENPVAWNDSATAGGGSGGGGVSLLWAIPSYQNAPAIVSSAASATHRNVPDISLPSSNNAGPGAFYIDGSWKLIGGTSWAAPQFAAMQAEVDQQCGESRWGLPDLYRVYYQSPAAFVDVTSGSITWPSTSLAYSASAGYDNASGLGLPIGEAIAVQDGC